MFGLTAIKLAWELWQHETSPASQGAGEEPYPLTAQKLADSGLVPELENSDGAQFNADTIRRCTSDVDMFIKQFWLDQPPSAEAAAEDRTVAHLRNNPDAYYEHVAGMLAEDEAGPWWHNPKDDGDGGTVDDDPSWHDWNDDKEWEDEWDNR